MKALFNKNGRKPDNIMIKRGLALLFAGCVLTSALAACGGDDKDKDSSSDASGVSSAMLPVSTPTPTPAPTAKAVRVTVDDSLNVRESASTDANILGSVGDGDELALLTDTAQNGWYQVSYNGGTGYVYAEYVKVIDVTVERYNALLTTTASTPTPEPDSSADPAASATPAASGEPSSSPSSDSEDGE